MIPEAREVHLSRKDRKVLEACCRSPMTMQRDLKRARIVLLAAAGRSTRSIAKEVGVQPRIVSLWRHRYAVNGGRNPGHWGGAKAGQFELGGGRSRSALFDSAVASERPVGFGRVVEAQTIPGSTAGA